MDVVNKHVAKNLNDFVSSDTLDWEEFIPTMAFAYKTTMHRTTMNTPFFLTYRVDHKIPLLNPSQTIVKILHKI
jgi:hypothetical protein